MTLDADRWGTAVFNAVDGLSVPQDRVITDEELEDYWQVICGEHKDEITTNAVVTTAVAVASVSGVTPGGGISGPGAGTGTGGVS